MTSKPRQRRRDASRTFPALGVLALVPIAVILYIAFTASSGLPLEQRYEIAVQVQDANRIIKNAEVRIGGIAVGRVVSATAVAPGNGRPPYADLDVSIKSSAGPLPVDTHASVRPASVLGLTYLQLLPGSSARKIPQNGTLSVAQSSKTVDLTDLFGVFNRTTATNFQKGMSELGAGFSGRGRAFNVTIGSSSRLMSPLTNVAAALADPTTQLRPLIGNYDATVSALGPVRTNLADLVTNGATTFGALGNQRSALGQTIDTAPSAEAATAVAFTKARPALDGLAKLSRSLLPGAQQLSPALTDVNAALTSAQRPLHQLPVFSDRLRTTLSTVRRVVRDPATKGVARKASDLFAAGDTLMAPLAAAEVNCNLVPLWAQNFGGYLKAFGSDDGPAINNIVLTHLGADGEEQQNAKPSSNIGINYLPHEDQSECESNNEPYDGKQQLSNPPGLQTDDVPATAPPADATALARRVGLLTKPEGAP